MLVERFADDEHHVGLAFLTTRPFPILLLYVGTSFKFLFKFPIFQMRLPEVPKGVAFDGRVQLCRQIVIAVGICAENRALTPTTATAPANATFFQRLLEKRQLRNAALQPTLRKEKHGRSQQQCQCVPVKQKGRQKTLRLLLIGLM